MTSLIRSLEADQFLAQIFRWNPDDRSSARGLLTSSWLNTSGTLPPPLLPQPVITATAYHDPVDKLVDVITTAARDIIQKLVPIVIANSGDDRAASPIAVSVLMSPILLKRFGLSVTARSMPTQPSSIRFTRPLNWCT